MDIDLVISMSILEFLARRGIDDDLMKQVVSILPLPENKTLRWTKTMLLRTIHSRILEGRVSESILDLLEMIAEEDVKEGHAISETMKTAYCTVALYRTTRYIKKKGKCSRKYLDAVDRIWRVRIGNLEKMESADLISDQLRSWMKEIEFATSKKEVCKKLKSKNTRYDALKAIRVYVTETWKVMGPTFIELVAKKMVKPFIEPQNMLNTKDEEQDRDRTESSLNSHLKLRVRANCTKKDETNCVNQVGHAQNPQPNVVGDVGVTDEPSRIDLSQFDSTVEKFLMDNKKLSVVDESILRDEDQEAERAAMTLFSLALLDEDADNGNVELTIDTSSKEVDSIPPSEACILDGANKSSSVELRANDPLDSEINHILSHSVDKSVERVQTCENFVPDPSSSNPNEDVSRSPSQDNRTLITKGVEGNEDTPVKQDGDPRTSLMERNGTPQTSKGVDSSYSSPESCLSTELHQSYPKKRKAVSPAKKSAPARMVRVRKRWSKVEEDTLRTGVEKFGRGNWKFILNSYREFFEDRTEVDLKDKWRNLMKK